MTLSWHLALVGMPGSGKTTVGGALAAVLRVGLVCVDERVEAAAGKSIAKIFASCGEAAFRRRESEALAGALAGQPAVIDTGGGLAESGANRAALLKACCRCVYLCAGAQLLRTRVGTGRGRPMLDGCAPQRLEELLVRREPFYRQVANLTVEVRRGRTPDALAAEIKNWIDEGAQG